MALFDQLVLGPLFSPAKIVCIDHGSFILAVNYILSSFYLTYACIYFVWEQNCISEIMNYIFKNPFQRPINILQSLVALLIYN